MLRTSFAKRLISRNALRLEAVALSLCALPVMAAVVDSGPINIVIPDTTDGLYLNVVTLANGGTASAAPGWDVNPYSSVVATNFTLWGPTANTWYNPQGIITGNYNLPPGTTIQGADAAFFRPGGSNDVGPQFTLNSDQNFLGFRFANEANGGQIHFGYMQVQFGANVSTRTITRIFYEDVAGTAITIPVGVVDIAPTLTYSPTTAAGVIFPGGTAGSTSATIDISTTGAEGAGATAVTGCAISGPGAASFGAVSTTPADGIFNTGTTSGSIDLTCTRGPAEATATLSCTETATPTVAGSPFTRTWTLTCPEAIVPDVAPVAAIAAATLSGGSGTVTPTLTTPAEGTGSTTLSCSIPATAPSNFAITSNAAQTISTVAAPLAIGLSCEPQVAASTATLTCTQTATPGPNPADATATITCPAAATSVTAGPVSGTTVTLPSIILPASSASAAWSFTATGGPAVVTCTASGDGFSVSPASLNLTAGGAGSVTVTYSGSGIGTFNGSLDCTTTGSGGPFSYPLVATVGAPAVAVTVPSLGVASFWALILGALGLGMLSVARVRD
ncbi:hypothetical protein OS187_10980 [Xanthomonadaceae bacterium JHOS43]|nr:hypothetical protein [Xanthomonadaceae bacterium JHOS43]